MAQNKLENKLQTMGTAGVGPGGPMLPSHRPGAALECSREGQKPFLLALQPGLKPISPSIPECQALTILTCV